MFGLRDDELGETALCLARMEGRSGVVAVLLRC